MSKMGALRRDRIRRQVAWAACAALLLVTIFPPDVARAAELRQPTLDAYDRYVRLSEAQLDGSDASAAHFLWVDRLPAERRAAATAELQRGEVVIEPLETLSEGKPIQVPGGMIHDWIATVFIPGATLQQTLAFEENYDQHHAYFQPHVVRSKILSRDGDNFAVYFRLREQKVITSILDTDHAVHYQVLDATRAFSRSHTTRIQEVENAGTSEEKLRPAGDDNGFLWRMQTYWRFQEKGGGTYVECRSISLTRDIPTGLAWLVGPFVKSIPRESLTFTLGKTRSGLLQLQAAHPKSSAREIPE